MAKASAREKIMLRSSAKNKNGNPTGTAYYTYKNKHNTPDKIELEKYDPKAYDAKTGKVGFRVKFKERKIPK